jgi:hypothetical protein
MVNDSAVVGFDAALEIARENVGLSHSLQLVN